MIDGKNFFNQSINSDLVTYENMLDYSYFKDYYKMIAKDLSKQLVLDADPRAIQQIIFTANLRQSRKHKNVLCY